MPKTKHRNGASSRGLTGKLSVVSWEGFSLNSIHEPLARDSGFQVTDCSGQGQREGALKLRLPTGRSEGSSFSREIRDCHLEKAEVSQTKGDVYFISLILGPKGRTTHLLTAYLYYLYYCFFDCGAFGILVPQPGIKLMPLQWKLRVLTTEPPGKSHYM